MTCPGCGAMVQAHDLYCISCGRALSPADPTRHLAGADQSAYGAVAADPGYNVVSAPELQPAWQEQPAQPPPSAHARPSYATPLPSRQPDDRQQWASGSSFPGTNPYAGTPNTVSRGTLLNGRPITGGGRRSGSGLLTGLGAAAIAFLALLKGVGGAIFAGGLGFFKFYLLLRLFGWVFFSHSWLAVLIIVLIIGAIVRARSG